MYKEKISRTFIYEEQRALKWFLLLFYIIFFLYEVFYHYFYKNIDLNLPREVNYWMYFWLLFSLPIFTIFMRKEKVYFVKYIFVIGYFFTSILSEISIYSMNNLEYQSGNAVEVLVVLFTPFFINIRFFRVVTSTIVLKYIFLGIYLKSENTIGPIVLVLILSWIAYLILIRFQDYLKAIKDLYDHQLSGIVKGVIATIELKDPYTRGHSERVAYYAQTLANETGKFTPKELSSFHYACLLHDIGKVNIPDSILMKPGKLSKNEFEVIKTHPSVGEEAILKVKGLEDSLPIIKSHHERWDGKGYPEKLKGDSIPFLARVVSIADAFDAMTSSRSYRDALSVDEAYSRIIEGQGTQFDPQLVELFKEIFPSWVKFHRKYDWTNTLSSEDDNDGKEVPS
ncbi:HD-GYP domain-containing protein [Mesobacillus subterraneus]|uniref:HD-GYP domain-containing protein n=1 Tax=Mesobacillus subterraneus TaxID=285983 RepID=UPI0005CA162C|nr:HD-GYP domain-containing protein [Mesobacillus subterraneus]